MKNLRSWQKFYTTAGHDGRDKFQVCFDRFSNIICTIFSGCDQHNEGSASSTELSYNSNDRQRYEISW